MDDARGPAQTALLAVQMKAQSPGFQLLPCTLRSIQADGSLVVEVNGIGEALCDCLEGVGQGPAWQPGDRLLVGWTTAPGERPVILGRIGRHVSVQPHVAVAATESLTLSCGEASLTLRADGKVMIKGEDVLLRAKGTQRIRAGNVAIN